MIAALQYMNVEAQSKSWSKLTGKRQIIQSLKTFYSLSGVPDSRKADSRLPLSHPQKEPFIPKCEQIGSAESCTKLSPANIIQTECGVAECP